MSQATADVPDRHGVAVVGELALRLTNQVVEACAERGIVLMPLKGALLISRWPVLRGQRDLVDIDLLVRPADFQTVTQVLCTVGFVPTVRSSSGATFVSDAWPLSVDVHHRLFPHGLFRMSTDGVFSRAELDDSLFATPIARMSESIGTRAWMTFGGSSIEASFGLKTQLRWAPIFGRWGFSARQGIY
jgi:hypothetical protein